MPKSTYSNEYKEKLIEVVKEHSVLFDASNPMHKDSIYTTNVWSRIQQEMGDPEVSGTVYVCHK